MRRRPPTTPPTDRWAPSCPPRSTPASASSASAPGASPPTRAAGDHFTYFEIDPAIKAVAENTDFFTYLSDTAATVDVVVGDGRLKLAEEPAGEFDLIILDAFSSDSIPVHLLTREALREYVGRLAPGGSLVVHISNRIFDLEPVLTAAASDLGWTGLRGLGGATSDATISTGSKWVVLTPDEAVAERLSDDADWSLLSSDEPITWTDNYASVLSILQ